MKSGSGGAQDQELEVKYCVSEKTRQRRIKTLRDG